MIKRRCDGTFERLERIEWECAGGCGKKQLRVPNEAKRRKYCKQCAQKRSIAAMVASGPHPVTDEYRRKLSESLKKKWRSGTRKLNSAESRLRMGQTLRRKYVTGELVRPKYSTELLSKIGKKVSKALKGRVTRHTPISQSEKEAFRRMVKSRPDCQPNENHFRAQKWSVRSPTNRVFVFKNLAKFIREHPKLFLPEDVIDAGNKRHRCHAYSGLNSISPRLKHNVGSWKGWTWYSHLEHVVNHGKDLLDRSVDNIFRLLSLSFGITH